MEKQAAGKNKRKKRFGNVPGEVGNVKKVKETPERRKRIGNVNRNVEKTSRKRFREQIGETSEKRFRKRSGRFGGSLRS